MWKRIKESFDSGAEKIRWFSSLLSERVKIESSVVRLLYQSEQMERKKDELMKNIGQRVYELKGYSERYILKDKIIVEALNELEKISSEIEGKKKKASEISSSL